MGNLIQELLSLSKRKEKLTDKDYNVKEQIPVMIDDPSRSSIINKYGKKTKLVDANFITRYSPLKSKYDSKGSLITLPSGIVDTNFENTAVNGPAWIMSGLNNTQNSGCWHHIGGGYLNTISAFAFSSIGFGYINTITNMGYSSILSGSENQMVRGTALSAAYATIAGGCKNKISSASGFIGGGSSNDISSTGFGNNIPGGSTNVISGTSCYSAIVGGASNTINSFNYAIIAGNGITADRGNTLFANNLSLKSLPTSAAGLPAGSVWNNGGVLNIV